jgi:inosine-uridine nucleoside N-ribohydrolase
MIPARRCAAALLVIALAGCGGAGPSGSGAATTQGATATTVPTGTAASPPTAPATASLAEPSARTILADTDVAPDDLVALSFLLSAPNVTVVAITISGTGEAHCEGGVAVVLGLLEYLDAPQIPIACGRETPLAGDHAFPDGWREAADQGSGLELPATDRGPVEGNAVELIKGMAGDTPGLTILTLGPLTNLGDALQADPGLANRLGPVFIMGGALHVPGNILGPGAPPGNAVAEWNAYVDPHARAVVLESGLEPSFVSLDGTSQVPVTVEFAQRAIQTASQPASSVLAQLMNANPFMSGGSYFLWDPLAAEVAAGYPVGTLAAATVTVEEADGPETGFTRPTSGDPNCQYLAKADATTAEDTLLAVLDAP